MRRLAPLALCAVTLAACGGDDRSATETRAEVAPLRELAGAQDRAPTPTTAATLVQLADLPRTRGRIGYVNTARTDELGDILRERDVLRTVLQDGARHVDRDTDAVAVRVAGATVVSGDRGRRVIGGRDAAVRRALAATRPTTNVIMPGAQSAAQSCLGDTIAQTLLGPAVLGDDTAVGVGLRSGDDAPAGLKLVICSAPHFVRDVHGGEKRFAKRFTDPGAIVEEVEIGERETVTAVVPAASLPEDELLELLSGGSALRRLAVR